MSQVFFAYTKDGQQFDGIEAIDSAAAHADIARKYEGKTTVRILATEVDLDGFKVKPMPVPVELFRMVEYWSFRLALCADTFSANAAWVHQQFIAAHDRMGCTFNSAGIID